MRQLKAVHDATHPANQKKTDQTEEGAQKAARYKLIDALDAEADNETKH